MVSLSSPPVTTVSGGLSVNTDTAFRDGAFGLPWWKCENEKGGKDRTEALIILDRWFNFLGVGREGQVGMREMV